MTNASATRALGLALSLLPLLSAPAAAADAAPPAAAPAPAKAEPAAEAKPENAQKFHEQYALRCIAPFVNVQKPTEVTVGGVKLKIDGYKATVGTKDRDDETRIGVLSAIKDSSPETTWNVQQFLDWFKKEKVEVIVLNGDLAYDEQELSKSLELVAKSGLLTLALIGNSETVAAFNSAVDTLSAKYPNLVNLNLVRVVQLDDAALVSLPGYYNRVFIHAAGGCFYSKDDLEALGPVVAGLGKTPVVLVSHGPPRAEGKEGIDFAVEAGNVGNPDLTAFLRDKKINVGVFGHILEAGGRATKLDGAAVLPEKAMTDALYVNAGSASATPWQMNDGSVSTGLAVIVTVKGKKASYQVKRFGQDQERPGAEAAVQK